MWVEPPRPVDGAGDSSPISTALSTLWRITPFFFMDVRHSRSVQNAVIGRLSAPSG